MTQEDYIDEAITGVGYGRWQFPFVSLTLLVHAVLPVHIVGSILLSVPMDFRCTPMNTSGEILTHDRNQTINAVTSNTLMMPVTEPIYDNKCGSPSHSSHDPPSLPRYVGPPSCLQVEYDTSVFPESIISEATTSTNVSSHRCGRKRTMQLFSVVNLVGVVLMATSPWYTGVLLAKLLVGGSCSPMLHVSFGLAQEVIPRRFRTLTGMLIGTSYSVSTVMFSGLGYLVRQWRHLLLTSSSFLLIIIPLTCIMQESPRWLVQRGRGEEAVNLLTTAAQCNHAELSPSVTSAINKLKEIEPLVPAANDPGRREIQTLCEGLQGWWEYLKFPGLRTILLVTPLVWFLQGFVYLGLILNANNFTSNNPYEYLALWGVMEAIAILLATPFNIILGRRILCTLCLQLAGLLLIVDLLVPTGLQWARWSLMMVAILLASAAFQVNFMYAPELFPTVIRSRGCGLVSSAANIGFTLSPIITDLLV
ncbi:Organic cation transporter protein-like 11 [Homarus americanus]|uniref:Organic cation transporter protein-like 11 n=1 Tax=Homarus americanus TaxID=6706 RepID=A0A8J5T036_HOMAM|nr:Organic cation transporter protein-like 11 [Homarus americanus]